MSVRYLAHRHARRTHKAWSVRRLAHMYGELATTADQWPLGSRERRLLEEAARGLRTALRPAREDDHD